MALRRESPQERDARKKLETYFRATRSEQDQFEGTCVTFLTLMYFWHGEKLRDRLLKGQPYKEWTSRLNRCAREQIRALVDDKKALENASADKLVSGTSFSSISYPGLIQTIPLSTV